MKKLVSVVLCVLLLASVAIIPAAAEDEVTCPHKNTVCLFSKDPTLFKDGFDGPSLCLDCGAVSVFHKTDALTKGTIIYDGYELINGFNFNKIGKDVEKTFENIDYAELATLGVSLVGMALENTDFVDQPVPVPGLDTLGVNVTVGDLVSVAMIATPVIISLIQNL